MKISLADIVLIVWLFITIVTFIISLINLIYLEEICNKVKDIVILM